MSKNAQVPRIFEKLNRFNVPVWSLLFNFVVGMIMFLPFPGWSELVGFISSAVILSLAFGPVSLAALRYQVADLKRPFRLPFGISFSAISFVFVGYVVYWTGWQTNWKVLLTVPIGLIVLTLARITSSETPPPLNLRESILLWPYIAGLGAVSYLGSYGKGLGLLSEGVAMTVITIFSLAIFALAIKLRLPDEQARNFVNNE